MSTVEPTSDFEALVAKEVREKVSTEELDTLKANVRQWLTVLNSFKRNVELQLTAQKAKVNQTRNSDISRQEYVKWKADQDDWRLGAIRFMVSVEQKIMEVKSYRAELTSVGK